MFSFSIWPWLKEIEPTLLVMFPAADFSWNNHTFVSRVLMYFPTFASLKSSPCFLLPLLSNKFLTFLVMFAPLRFIKFSASSRMINNQQSLFLGSQMEASAIVCLVMTIDGGRRSTWRLCQEQSLAVLANWSPADSRLRLASLGSTSNCYPLKYPRIIPFCLSAHIIF